MRTSTFVALTLALCRNILGRRQVREFSTRQISKTVTLDIFQDPSAQYYLTNISIGTPPQNVTVQLDTGSSDLWVYSNNVSCGDSADDVCIGPYFNPEQSSSFQRFGDGLFNITYGDGSGVTGDYVLDTVHFGGITLHDVTMGLATTAYPVGLPLWGIMGIGVPSNERSFRFDSEYYNLPYQMVAQGLINEPVYSLYLNDVNAPSGTLLFGGIDTDKFDGPLVILDAIPAVDSAGRIVPIFQLDLTAIGGMQSGNSFASFDFPDNDVIPALLDSGATSLHLPESTVKDIATQLNFQGDDIEEEYYVPCILAEYNITLEFQFGGSSGPQISMPLSEVISPSPYTQVDGQDMCYVWIVPTNDSYSLGAPFLRSAYAVFDPGNNQIALAQAIPNVTSSHVDALSAVASVPSSIGTLPASFVGPGYGYGTGGIPGSTFVDDLVRATATATTTEDLCETHSSVAATSAALQTSLPLYGGSSIPDVASLGLASYGAAQINTAATTTTAGSSTGPVPVSATTHAAGAANYV